MNYFELINKCLVELNYKQVNAFSELTKNDHKKIKNILNVINNEVCAYDNWNFKLKRTTLTLPANTSEIKNTINGRISSLRIEKQEYWYFERAEDYINKKAPSHTYSAFNDNLLLPEFDEEKTIDIIYYTADNAVDEDGLEKFCLENGTDQSLIPAVFAEPILVYGTCMRLKANPSHVKFSYWMSMYNSALANMRSKIAISADFTSAVKMHRR